MFGSKFQKSNTFGSMKICGYIFFFFGGGGGGGGERGVITESDFFLLFFGGMGVGSLLYILGLFKVNIQNGNIFLGRKISNIFGYS